VSGLAANPDPLRVLVVDDTPDLRDLIAMALERTGEFVVVAHAENGREAITAAGQHAPDLVLLDIAMPVMDGLEALPRVRAACPDAIVLMLSGFGASEMTAKALAGGADGYLQKGQSLGTLLSQLRTMIATVSAQRSAQEPEVVSAAPPPAHLDHLELAPFGFLLVQDGRLVRANREAGRLLGDLTGGDLGAVAPELARHLAAEPAQDTVALLDLGEDVRRVMVTVRHSGSDQAVYLQTQSGDEAELLRRAIATAAHEIRNPVGVLMGVAETLVLHGEELTSEERHRMLGAIGRQTRLLDNITADLLAAGQAQHGTIAVQLEHVDPTDIVQAVIDDTFDLTLVNDARPLVVTDPMRLQQMLGNLLSNARKYGEPPFEVRVTRDGTQVHIAVEDSGPGVPEEFRPRLFQEYSRAPGSRAHGTGLGLFVVRALAEAQGGSVTYAPRVPQGSVFTLSLPAAVNPPPAAV
jgi:signal transduction histidine kinase/ActR/RegA family two-component response regulator